MKKAFIILAALLISTVCYAGDIGMCLGDCAAEQGMCIGQCQGDGNCIGNCAAAHGRCVARCHSQSSVDREVLIYTADNNR